MRRTALALAPLLACLLSPPPAAAAPCGGPWGAFVQGLQDEAAAEGATPAQLGAFFRGSRDDARVLRADRAQGVFQKSFIDFARAVISRDRVTRGTRMSETHAALFDRIERETGVPRGVLLAFWALETDYGQVQGDFNTRDALMTLAHDCRRPALFRPQVLAAIALYRRGDFDPQATTGAWAGEIGQVQMLPADILAHGRDGDGDGHVRLKTSSADALVSAAAKLADIGWRPGEPWLQEVVLPDDPEFDWSQTGLDTALPVEEWRDRGVTLRAAASTAAHELPASLLLPMGRDGPAFLAYPNFRVLFHWNQSFVYVTTAAYFATRLEGAGVFDARRPAPGLDAAAMRRLQERLAARGHDVGEIDGILGARTRAAVQAEQLRLGLPADAWPTPALLSELSP
ncbi:lytic murein transglycosylase [Frigidibacter sp. MR17.24]|uniref:lytic murein transglycosylase n=1 Tax=Frigidibacter sp. MR17.24 TaxID=3127345 RepID=UPI003012DB8F